VSDGVIGDGKVLAAGDEEASPEGTGEVVFRDADDGGGEAGEDGADVPQPTRGVIKAIAITRIVNIAGSEVFRFKSFTSMNYITKKRSKS
jgi:hypothetical protein